MMPDLDDATAFAVVNMSSGKCLDLKDWSTANYGSLQQWDCSGGSNQSFRFLTPGSSTPTVAH
jgi:hypothetical protein